MSRLRQPRLQEYWKGMITVGARTPEELETLFEDALLLHDGVGLAKLFDEGAVVAVDGQSTARGAAIPEAVLALWADGPSYVADPKRVLAAQDVALIVAERGVNVARRDRGGAWRYAIVCRTNDTVDGSNGKEGES